MKDKIWLEQLITDWEWDDITDNISDDYADGLISYSKYKREMAEADRMLDESYSPELDQSVRDFYIEAYPTDDLGTEINPKLTFDDIRNLLNTGGDVYDVIPGDSIVRERIFEKLSELLNTKYDNVYYAWLHNPEIMKAWQDGIIWCDLAQEKLIRL